MEGGHGECRGRHSQDHKQAYCGMEAVSVLIRALPAPLFLSQWLSFSPNLSLCLLPSPSPSQVPLCHLKDRLGELIHSFTNSFIHPFTVCNRHRCIPGSDLEPRPACLLSPSTFSHRVQLGVATPSSNPSVGGYVGGTLPGIQREQHGLERWLRG